MATRTLRQIPNIRERYDGAVLQGEGTVLIIISVSTKKHTLPTKGYVSSIRCAACASRRVFPYMTAMQNSASTNSRNSITAQ